MQLRGTQIAEIHMLHRYYIRFNKNQSYPPFVYLIDLERFLARKNILGNILSSVFNLVIIFR